MPLLISKAIKITKITNEAFFFFKKKGEIQTEFLLHAK